MTISAGFFSLSAESIRHFSHFCEGVVGGRFCLIAKASILAQHRANFHWLSALTQFAQTILFRQVVLGAINSYSFHPLTSLFIKTIINLGVITSCLAKVISVLLKKKEGDKADLNFLDQWVVQEAAQDIQDIGDTFGISPSGLKKWVERISEESLPIIFVGTVVGMIAMGMLGHKVFFLGAALSFGFAALETYTTYIPKEISHLVANLSNLFPLLWCLCGNFSMVSKVIALLLFCYTSSRESYVGQLFHPLMDRIENLVKTALFAII